MTDMTKVEVDKLFKEMMFGDSENAKQMRTYAKEVIDFLDAHPKEYMLLKAISKSLFENFLEDIEIQRSNPDLHGGDEVIIEKHRHVMYNIAAFVYAMKKFCEEEAK